MLTGVRGREGLDGAAGAEAVGGAVGGDGVKDLAEDKLLELFEARLGDFDETQASVRLGKEALVVVVQRRHGRRCFRCKVFAIGEPGKRGRGEG